MAWTETDEEQALNVIRRALIDALYALEKATNLVPRLRPGAQRADISRCLNEALRWARGAEENAS